MPQVTNETVENVMQVPAIIMATYAGTLNNFHHETISDRGRFGGSFSLNAERPGITPMAPTIRNAYCQPWRSPIIPPSASPPAPPSNIPEAKIDCVSARCPPGKEWEIRAGAGGAYAAPPTPRGPRNKKGGAKVGAGPRHRD